VARCGGQPSIDRPTERAGGPQNNPKAKRLTMRQWFKDLDGLLRGELTRLPALKAGRIELPAGRLAAVTVLLGLAYGVCMGFYAVFREGGPVWEQFTATVVKIPLLFGLTLLVTFPSLYVFNVIAGSRLTMVSVLRLLVAALAVNLAVLASLGPIVAFFSVSTTSYSFTVLLNVAMCTVSGVFGLMFLLQTMHRLVVVLNEPVPGPAVAAAAPVPAPAASLPPPMPPLPSLRKESAIDPLEGRVLGRHEKLVFRCWIVVFALVGSQMAWVLRPFVGSPDRPFSWLRPRQSSFLESVWRHFLDLFQ
jgi:hypothetical protein